MRIKKHLRGFLGVFLAMVLTVGCAGGGGQQSGPADGSGASVGNTENSQEGGSETTIKGKQLYLGEYTRLLMKDSVPAWEYQNKELYADTYDGVVYILEEYNSVEGEDISRQFFLATYENGVTELSWEPFVLDFPEKGRWFIRSMAVPEEGKLSFWVCEYGSKNAETSGGLDAASDFLAVTDLKGNLLSLTESIPEEEEYPWNRIGTLVVRGADGSMAISRMEKERNYQTVFYSYDPETGRREEIGVSVEDPNAIAIYPEGNMLYYVDGNRHLFRWDDREKKLTDMMDLTDINFPTRPDFTFILPGGAGRLLLCSLSTEMLQAFALSEEERHPEDEIRMSILRESSAEYKLETAAEYNYAHWNCPISTERPEKNEEDAYRNRIMAQIAAGKGPDLMLVTAEDMLLLAEKGVLLDLAELIPEETMGQLFQCAVQDGTVDGKMVGLHTELMIDTLLTADATWSGDSWTLEEFLKLQEEYQWEWPIGGGYLSINPMRCLKALLPDLGHSQFLDMEAGIARFDSDEFVRVLEICKNYGSDNYNSNGPNRKEMLAQECGACGAWVSDLFDFSYYMSEYGEKAHFVGYPAEGGGNYTWTYFSYLVVNANSEHKDEIKEYIAMLLDYERQFNNTNFGFSVRRDVIRDSVVMVDGVPLTMGRLGLGSIDLKPDGTTYLEEFLDFVDGCKAGVKWPSLIEQIMEEELAPYFKGDKSAREAADLVQNRVQLYLDER